LSEDILSSVVERRKAQLCGISRVNRIITVLNVTTTERDNPAMERKFTRLQDASAFSDTDKPMRIGFTAGK